MTEEFNYYFDWASTALPDNEILREALEESLVNWANPSSAHEIGKKAKEALEKARQKCADILKVKADTLYFTSGGTESDHIPILSVLNRPQKGEILLSSIEHPAVREMSFQLKKCGWTVKEIPCRKDGIINLEEFEKLLTSETVLVSVMLVNNETGAIQPIEEIARIIREKSQGKRKAKLHVDCVQALGKIPLNLNIEGLDSAAFSAHKISGPRGIGLLYMKDKCEPFLKGGGQEKAVRSGTENLFGAIAFAKAIEKYAIREENPESMEMYNRQKENTDYFLKALSEIPASTIIPKERLEKKENYSSFVVQAAFDKIPGQVMQRALDSKKVYISTGSACSSRKNNRPILEAMGVNSNLRENAVRFSFGHSTKKEEIDFLLEKIREVNSTFNS